MKKFHSFSTRLSLNVVLVTSILFILAIGIAALSSHKLLAEEAETSAGHLLDATILEVENTLKEVEVAVETSSWTVLADLDEPESFFELTHKIVDGSKVISGFGVSFAPYYYKGKEYFSPYTYRDADTGNLVTKNIDDPEYSYFYTDWYLLPNLLGKAVWTEPYHGGAGLNSSIITYAYPLRDAKGNIIAIINADVMLSWITGITEKIHPYPNSELSLFTRTGTYIHLKDDSEGAGETLLSLATQFIPEPEKFFKSIMDTQSGINKFNVDREYQFMVHGTLRNGWKAVIRCDYREILKRISNMNLVLILVGLFGLLILFVICYLTIRRLTKPLLEFSKSATSIAGGNFNTTLPDIETNDEIGLLKDSFQDMQHSLVDYIHELKTTTASKERIESELNIASKIQMSMLPKDFPHLDSIDLHAILRPAKEVGGDLYDFLVKGNYLYFSVGDVSGKGVPASMFMAITRSTFHFLASSAMDISIEEIVSYVNDACCNGNDTNMFVTFFAGRLNLKTGELDYCNAGHNPVIKINSDGTAAEFLDVIPNLALGLFPSFPYRKQTITLAKDERLILYTDGVTEAEKEDKSQYGDARLLEWSSTAGNDYNGAMAACEGLYASVKAFTDGNEQNDDITIMTIKYL